MNKSRFLLTCSIIMIIGLCKPVNAETPSLTQQIETKERAVCDRPMLNGRKNALRSCMAKQYTQSKKKLKHAKNKSRKIGKILSNANCIAPLSDYYYMPNKEYISYRSLHELHDVSPTGSTIELNNGAIFSISTSDEREVRSWGKKASVRITPNNRWFSWASSYEYLLVNEMTGATAEAKITMGPYKNSPNTRKIVKLDFNRGIVTLDNGTIWQVNNTSKELRLVRDWIAFDPNPYNPKEGDFIIVGDNNYTWWSNKNILINIATNSYLTFSPLN